LFQRISYKKLRVQQGSTREFETPLIDGEIEKIFVVFSDKTIAHTSLTIMTSEEERILDVAAQPKTSTYYPRNNNAIGQRYVGRNMQEEGHSYVERWSIHGRLKLSLRSSGPEDSIEQLDIIIRGRVFHTNKPTVDLMDALARKLLSELPDDGNITKQDTLTNVRAALKESVYKQRFSGIDWDTSKAMQAYMVRAITNGYPEKRVLDYLTNKKPGLSRGLARNIWLNEQHELRNKVREVAFSTTDPEGDAKYNWLGPDDLRTTTTCTVIKRRVNDEGGVSLERLRQIIKEESANAVVRGEVDKDFIPREYTPHYNCRHVINRRFD